MSIITVTFNSNGGTAVAPYTTSTHGVTITAPASTKVRCTLEGWYRDAVLTNKWNFATDTVTANITFYAKWTYLGGTPITYVEDVGPYLQTQSAGGSAGNLANLPMQINLGTMTQAESGWRQMLDAIEAAGKYINLDLSACTMSGTVFNPDSAISTGKNKIVSITLPNIATSIQAGTGSSPSFRDFSSMTSITIGNNVTTIGNYAFYNSKLTSVTFTPTSKVTTIGNYAFAYNQLTNVTIPSSVTSLAGFDDNKLTSISIPNGVITLSGFSGNQLTSISIPSSVITIEDYAFADNYLTNLSIPGNVTTIGGNAFRNNALTSVTIPNNVTHIGRYAFSNNQLMTSVSIGNNVTAIEPHAFSACDLTSVTFVSPSKVTSIGYCAFESNRLSSVTIPNGVTIIEDSAFASNQMTSFYIPNSVTTIEGAAFKENLLTIANIPSSVTHIGNRAFAWNRLTNITIGANVTFGADVFSQYDPYNVVWYINSGFEDAYNTTYGKAAGTYRRTSTDSTAWAKQ
jgi:uncharacterized repeat protein (TIGR02543 family)